MGAKACRKMCQLSLLEAGRLDTDIPRRELQGKQNVGRVLFPVKTEFFIQSEINVLQLLPLDISSLPFLRQMDFLSGKNVSPLQGNLCPLSVLALLGHSAASQWRLAAQPWHTGVNRVLGGWVENKL